MKRVVIGFFLSLFLFLSSGYSQLYARGMEECDSYIPAKVLKCSLPGTEKTLYNIDATAIEEEDDDTSSSKKYLESRLCLTTTKQFVNDNVKNLELSGPSQSISPRCFILLRVFRI